VPAPCLGSVDIHNQRIESLSPQPLSLQQGVAKGTDFRLLTHSPQAPWERRHLAGAGTGRREARRYPRISASATPAIWKAVLPDTGFCDTLLPGASPLFAQPEMGSVRFRVQTMGRRPLPSAAHVRPGAHSARHPDSRNDLTPCRMAWHFVSDGAHAPHSDQTLGPTPTPGRRTPLGAYPHSLPCAPPGRGTFGESVLTVGLWHVVGI